MSEGTDPEEPEDALYVSELSQHLFDFQAHLAGVVDDVRPSYIAPTGYWTLSEKNVFFHALSVHSRFRPDLVAACVGTKTVIDVCAYIDSLDEALSLTRHAPLSRSSLKPAPEVSEAWVQREEQMARELIYLESEWEQQRLSLEREKEVSSYNALASNTRTDGGVEPEAVGSWEQDKQTHWDQEDLLSRLGYHHLRVMERILLKEELSANLDNNTLPEDQHSSIFVTLPSLPSATQSSARASHSPPVDDAMVDLRSLVSAVPDRLVEGVVPQGSPVTLPQADHSYHTCTPDRATSRPPSSPSLAPLAAQPMSSGRNPEHDRQTAVDLSKLSPLSRRRLSKRLYMRRKRAAMTGEEATVVVTKLRPGRKVEKQRSLNPRGVDFPADSESLKAGPDHYRDSLMDVNSNVQESSSSAASTSVEKRSEGDNVEQKESVMKMSEQGADNVGKKSSHPSGMTRPYKIQSEFELRGIRASTLMERNLGFFHLSTLSRLMHSGYGVANTNTATSISADTIQLLTAIVVDFITETVQRAIILREQQNSMKSGTKAHRYAPDELSLDNVLRALEMVGRKDQNKARYFAQLLDEDEDLSGMEEDDDPLRTNTSESEDNADEGRVDHDGVDDGDDDGVTSGNDEEYEDLNKPPILLPLHRETDPPFVYLPKPLASVDPQVFVGREELMPEETDEEELLDELDAEMEIDEMDQADSSVYEAGLWQRFGKEKGRKRVR